MMGTMGHISCGGKRRVFNTPIIGRQKEEPPKKDDGKFHPEEEHKKYLEAKRQYDLEKAKDRACIQ